MNEHTNTKIHIYICNLDKNYEEIKEMSDKEALIYYQTYYNNKKKQLEPLSENFFTDSLKKLPYTTNKDITYYEYENINNTTLTSDLEGLNLNKNKKSNMWWYMAEEIKDKLINCAEHSKKIAQFQLEIFKSEDCPLHPSDKIITDLEEQTEKCNNLINNLNYYHKMLIFTLC